MSLLAEGLVLLEGGAERRLGAPDGEVELRLLRRGQVAHVVGPQLRLRQRRGAVLGRLADGGEGDEELLRHLLAERSRRELRDHLGAHGAVGVLRTTLQGQELLERVALLAVVLADSVEQGLVDQGGPAALAGAGSLGDLVTRPRAATTLLALGALGALAGGLLGGH